MRFLQYSILILFLHLFTNDTCVAQYDKLIYEDKIYVDYIKSVAFFVNGNPLSYPIVELNSNDRLFLYFDDMGGKYYDYTYDLIHCDRNWNPSVDLQQLDYMDGFNEEFIEETFIPRKTIIDYTNYRLSLPNADTRWLISGNYLLVVNDDENLPIISRRFMVTEPLNQMDSLSINLTKPSKIKHLNSDQALDFNLTKINNTYQDALTFMSATIIQNGRWDNAHYDVKPSSELGTKIQFYDFARHSFPAIKEFRNFDIRSLQNLTWNVHSIDLKNNGTDVVLEIEKDRSGTNYLSDIDANGYYVYDNFDNGNIRDADYANVFFTLKTPELEFKDVYVLGKFNDYRPSEEYKMEYSFKYNCYTKDVLFKQGYYDYLFGVVDSDGNIDTDYYEGNWHTTENDYLIMIYYRPFGGLYDKIVGVGGINTETGAFSILSNLDRNRVLDLDLLFRRN